jgi:acyl carrier protein
VTKYEQSNIENWLADLISEILEVPPTEVDRTVHFDRYGLDSVAALTITTALEEHLERELDATVLYDYPTIAKLSHHLAEITARVPQ